jgi:hypothetical protein
MEAYANNVQTINAMMEAIVTAVTNMRINNLTETQSLEWTDMINAVDDVQQQSTGLMTDPVQYNNPAHYIDNYHNAIAYLRSRIVSTILVCNLPVEADELVNNVELALEQSSLMRRLVY